MNNNSFQFPKNISIPQNNKKVHKIVKSNNSISYKHINVIQNKEKGKK